MVRRRDTFLLMCLLIVSAIGCGPTSDRLAVSGTVKLKGEPLDDGIIEFISKSTRSGAPIIKGKYEVAADQGLPPGTYTISITAGDGKTPADSPDGIPGPTGANIISKDRIPAEFNTKSTKEVTVEKNKTNKFDFDIP